MDWNNRSILIFLRLYKMHPCIWNPKHTHHRNRNRVNKAWASIQNNMPVPCTIPQLKKKKESLMSAYRAYKTKIKNSTSVTGESTYHPSWFAFDTIDSFLSSVYLRNPNFQENEKQQNTTTSENDNETDTNQNSETEEINEETAQEITQEKMRYLNAKRSHSPSHQYNAKRPVDRYNSYNPPSEDECEIVARLWAKKLRKLPEDRRDVLIYKINNIMYGESIEHFNRANSPSNMIIPSPIHIFHEEESVSRHSIDSGTSEEKFQK